MSQGIDLSHHEVLAPKIRQEFLVVEIVQKHFTVELFDERVFALKLQAHHRKLRVDVDEQRDEIMRPVVQTAELPRL